MQSWLYQAADHINFFKVRHGNINIYKEENVETNEDYQLARIRRVNDSLNI
jgi:hypothetical protein